MAGKKKVVKKRAANKKTVAKPAATEKFKVEPGWLNKKQMAKQLKISVQAFDKWEVQPVARRHKYGEAFYSVGDVMEFVDKRAREQERRKLEKLLPTDADGLDVGQIFIEKEKAELTWTRERAEGQRLKNAQMRRELAPVEMVVWALGSVAGQVTAILGTLPAKLKRSQPKLSADEINIVKSEIVKAQNACAKEVEIAWDDFVAESD